MHNPLNCMAVLAGWRNVPKHALKMNLQLQTQTHTRTVLATLQQDRYREGGREGRGGGGRGASLPTCKSQVANPRTSRG